MRSLVASDGADRYPLNAVVAVAKVIPLGTLRLTISGLIGIDPGFAHNPGIAGIKYAAEQSLAEKLGRPHLEFKPFVIV